MNKKLEFRGIHYDLARGNYYPISPLKNLIKFCSDCRINKIIFYMEDLWKYKKHSILSNPAAYNIKEMGELSEYGNKKGVEVIPSITTLGHSHHILRKKGYENLGFVKGRGDFDVFNPDVYKLFSDIFDEVLPHFESKYVFINGDEVDYSYLNKRGESIAERKGLGFIYGTGMGRIAEMVLERGKIPIMWHDMLIHHPEAIDLIPKQTVIAYWFYDYQKEFPAIKFFTEKGFKTIACPGLLRHQNIPDFPRALPNIQGQIKECFKNKIGKCPGAMTTIWEKVKWEHAILVIYATGKWCENPDIPVNKILEDFSKDVFGTNSKIGNYLFNTSYFAGKIHFLKTCLNITNSCREKLLLKKEIRKEEKKIKNIIEKSRKIKPIKNKNLYKKTDALLRKPLNINVNVVPEKNKKILFSPALIDPNNKKCRVEETTTPFNHKLLITTNGEIALGILPEFSGTIIEWVLLENPYFSFFKSDYYQWAKDRKRVPGDITLFSPWATTGIGGWRETVFWNARANPSSLWGRKFKVKKFEENGKVSLQFYCKTEKYEIIRKISLSDGRKFEINITVKNISDEKSYLAIQPNVIHNFPETSPAFIRLLNKDKNLSIIEHNGTKYFYPVSNKIKFFSTLTGRYIQLEFKKREVEAILIDTTGKFFTVEPFTKIKKCNKGENVHLFLCYEVGEE